MRPNDFDVTLYDSGAHTLIDSVADPLVALNDKNALDALTGYLTVHLAQPESLGLVANKEALEAFILHAQRVHQISVEFLDESFSRSVLKQVPTSPPVAPPNLWLTDAGSGVLNASSDLGQNCDRYELQQQVDGTWVTVAQGVPREDGVDYQVTGLTAGSHSFRVVARWGFFAGFPGAAQSVDVS